MAKGTPAFAGSRAGLLISAVLAAELFAAGCGSVIPMEDADALEGDVAADVEQDVPDAVEESANPDVPEADVAEEDVSSPDGEDARDAEEVPEAVDAPDVAEGTDVPVCEPVIYTETRPAEPAGMICGINREKIVTLRVTEYGEGCPRPHRETSLESILYRITRPLDIANLICARGNETELLNPGVYMIIDLSTAEMRVGRKIVSMPNMRVGDVLNGGVYKLELYFIAGTSVAENRLLDSTGTFLRDIEVPAQNGYPARYAAINSNYGAFAWDQVDNVRSSQAIIALSGGLPIVLAHLGTHDYESPGDEGGFTVRLNIDGMGSDDSYGFFRDRSKK